MPDATQVSFTVSPSLTIVSTLEDSLSIWAGTETGVEFVCQITCLNKVDNHVTKIDFCVLVFGHNLANRPYFFLKTD